MIKRFNLCSLCGVLSLLLISLPAHAQDIQEENVTVIEVTEDGTVTVNGEVVDGDGTITIKSKYDGGNETVRVFRRDGNGFTSDFNRMQSNDAERLLRRFERQADNANGNFYLFRDGDIDAERLFQRSAELNNLFRSQNAVRWGDGDIASRYRVFTDDDNAAVTVFGNRLNGQAREARQEQLKAQMEIMKMEAEAVEIAAQMRRATAEERLELEEKLNEHVNTIFDMKMDMRQAEIDLLEKQLAEERNAFEQRMTERERMIERRKRELLGERDALDW